MGEKIRIKFSIPTHRMDVMGFSCEPVDYAAFEAEFISKLEQAGISDYHIEPENILAGMTVYEGRTLVVNCVRGMDMVAVRIFMCLVIKYAPEISTAYYSYEWGNLHASLSVGTASS
ncbi:MAG: hypothetical protein K2M91_04285 [Lachnospiraceae bacterium]|nr:hypothetical protein [Lachnospiraceae bacterium]